MNYVVYNEDWRAEEIVTEILNDFLKNVVSDVVVVCIGTDLVTGDSYGPLVGTLLKQKNISQVAVYGTLEDPVHALNIEKTIQQVESVHPSSFIICVDASLGKKENIGALNLINRPLQPGAGVGKDLPSIGHCSIKGIVNVSGKQEFHVLQNTRLHLVWKLAELTVASLSKALSGFAKMKDIN